MQFWVALALATLTKGPVGPGVAAVVVLAALGLWWRRRRRFGGLCWVRGIAVFLAIGLPWVLLVQHATGGRYLQSVWLELTGRATEAQEGHRLFPGFYFVNWMLELFPWSVFLPAAMIWHWTKRRRDRRLWLLAAWLFLPRLGLECITTQLPHYALPTLPGGALLLAAAASRGFGWGRRLWDEQEGKLTAVLLGSASLLGAVGLPMALGVLKLYAALPAAIALGLCTAGLGWIGCRQIIRGRLHAAGIWQMVGVAAISCLVLGGWLVPSLEEYRLGRIAAAEVLRHAGQDDRLVLLGWEEPSTVFYLGRDVPAGREIRDRVWIASGAEEVAEFAGRAGRTQVVIVSADRQDGLVRRLPRAEPLTPSGVWGINWGNPMAHGEFFQPVYIYRVPPSGPATGQTDAPRPG